MKTTEFWAVLEWSGNHNRWIEKSNDFPSEQEAIDYIKSYRYPTFLKTERQFQIQYE